MVQKEREFGAHKELMMDSSQSLGWAMKGEQED